MRIFNELSNLVGKENVSDKEVDRINYSHDLWQIKLLGIKEGEIGNLPDYIVWVEDKEQVSKILKLANELKFNVIPYGGGAGVCGGAVTNTSNTIVLDVKKMDKIIDISDKSLLATVQPGVVGQNFEDELNKRGYTFQHFPASIFCSTVGGFVSTRAAGQLSAKYGKIEDMVVSLEVVLPTGEIIRTKNVPRSSTGPSLTQLFLGSEGTLGVITEITLRIHHLPPARLFRGIIFKTVGEGLEAVRKILQTGIKPACVRLYDPISTSMELQTLKVSKEKSGFGFYLSLGMNIVKGIMKPQVLLILSFEGYLEIIEKEQEISLKICKENGGEDLGPSPGEEWWKHRYNLSFQQARIMRMGALVDTIEVVTSWDNILSLYENMRKAMRKHVIVLAHFSHAYPDGCSIYFTILARAGNLENATKKYNNTWRAGMEACLSAGGSISHHHGIGLVRVPYMKQEMGESLLVLKKIKNSLDPNNILNPHKLIPQ